ncbi:hypothetical protein [Actinomadura meridiana]|uniref:hypothetical protein n=1 Tax=Actinomadura meridiana TaxID=559626 RepID=UPI0031F15C25
MRVEELLTEIEPLPYRERCLRLAALRRHTGGPEIAALLNDLSRGAYYERSVALFVAAAVRDEASLAHLGAAVQDPDAGLACEAIRLGVRFGVDATPFLDGLADAPAAARSALYDAVRRYRRADLADALVDAAAERWGDAEAAALLPACNRDVAAGRVDGLAHAVPNWAPLGRSHPDVVLDYAERRLAELPESVHAAWWFVHAPGVAATVGHAPGRVIALLERYVRTGPLPSALEAVTGRLIAAEPARVLRLLLSDGYRTHLRGLLNRRSVRDRLARLDDAAVAAVARQGAVRDELDLLLFALDLSDRLIGHSGSIHLGDLGRTLRRGDEHRLGASLAPRLEAAARRDDVRRDPRGPVRAAVRAGGDARTRADRREDHRAEGGAADPAAQPRPGRAGPHRRRLGRPGPAPRRPRRDRVGRPPAPGRPRRVPDPAGGGGRAARPGPPGDRRRAPPRRGAAPRGLRGARAAGGPVHRRRGPRRGAARRRRVGAVGPGRAQPPRRDRHRPVPTPGAGGVRSSRSSAARRAASAPPNWRRRPPSWPPPPTRRTPRPNATCPPRNGWRRSWTRSARPRTPTPTPPRRPSAP